jgi:hypothetical protein
MATQSVVKKLLPLATADHLPEGASAARVPDFEPDPGHLTASRG